MSDFNAEAFLERMNQNASRRDGLDELMNDETIELTEIGGGASMLERRNDCRKFGCTDARIGKSNLVKCERCGRVKYREYDK